MGGGWAAAQGCLQRAAGIPKSGNVVGSAAGRSKRRHSLQACVGQLLMHLMLAQLRVGKGCLQPLGDNGIPSLPLDVAQGN